MAFTVLRALTRGAVALAALAASSGSGLAAAEHPDFTGVWQVSHFIAAIKTLSGDTPPLRPEALKLYRQRLADRAVGKAVDDPIDACLPHGIPRLMYAPYPMLLLQRPDQLSLVQQANHTQRLIYIGGRLPSDGDPKWLGDAVAHWEGDTLMITTTDFNDKTWLDRAGLPHSEDMTVTERLALADGGKALQDTITVDDPKTYTAPWSTRITFDRKPGLKLQESSCSVNHKM